MKPEFKTFPKIPRYNREIVVTEKLDGTNGIVHVAEDGNVTAGSRNRWITPQDDNYGFAAWVEQNAEELRNLGPGYHYGEWWGRGIQRGYGLQERRFSLFNVGRWTPDNPPPKCCHVVPVIGVAKLGEFSLANTMHNMRENGSYAAPGFMNPEGIIVYHIAGGTYFKATFDDKSKG